MTQYIPNDSPFGDAYSTFLELEHEPEFCLWERCTADDLDEFAQMARAIHDTPIYADDEDMVRFGFFLGGEYQRRARYEAERDSEVYRGHVIQLKDGQDIKAVRRDIDAQIEKADRATYDPKRLTVKRIDYFLPFVSWWGVPFLLIGKLRVRRQERKRIAQQLSTTEEVG